MTTTSFLPYFDPSKMKYDPQDKKTNFGSYESHSLFSTNI